MTYEEREKIYKEIWDFCKKTWDTKGKDYAKEDVLSNFKETAAKYGVTSEMALTILLDKHLIAISTWIKKGELKGELIDDKVLDAINYLGMLLCLIREKNKKKNKPKIKLI